MLFPTLFLLLSGTLGAEDSCDASSGECSSDDPASKYSDRWAKYHKLIAEAEESYTPCPKENCACFEGKIAEDLRPFQASGITKQLFDASKAAFPRANHYQIIGGRVFRSKDCLFGPRCKGIEHFLHILAPSLPDMEFVLNERDYPQLHRRAGKGNLPVFSFSKTRDYLDIEYPAWAFWEGGPAISLHPTGIGRWDLMRRELSDAAKQHPWAEKDAKGFFRGSRTSAERDPLVLLSRTQPGLVDAQYTKNQAWKSDADTLGAPPAAEVHFKDHCKYRFLFNFRGVAASFRLKHLFLCGSLVLHVGDEYTEFFYPALKPWIHYVPLSSGLGELEEVLEFLRASDAVAARIASRGREFVERRLGLEDVECYWRRLLTDYAALLRYKVKRDPALVTVKP